MLRLNRRSGLVKAQLAILELAAAWFMACVPIGILLAVASAFFAFEIVALILLAVAVAAAGSWITIGWLRANEIPVHEPLSMRLEPGHSEMHETSVD